MSSSIIPLQSNISGFGGKPETLFSVYDSDSAILVISKLSKLTPERYDKCLMIGNDSRYAIDFAFNDDLFRDAIKAYYELKNSLSNDGNSSRLVFGEKALNADPINSIELNGYDEGGAKYKFDSLTNARVATLATCLWAVKSQAVDMAIGMGDSMLNGLSRGGLLSVGGSSGDWQEERPIMFGFHADPRYISEDYANEMMRLYGTDS